MMMKFPRDCVVQFNSVQPLSHVQIFATPWTAACQASLSIANFQSLFKLMSIESVRPSNPLILWKILKEMEIPDHLTCLLRRFYAGQEAIVRTGHGTMSWFQIGKGVLQGYILSPCLFNLYAEYIMKNTGLEETQAGIKIAGRNTNNLRYADDTTLMIESKEELKSLESERGE